MSSSLYLVHHGVKGMKWGVRRFRNEDGTLTEAGKKRYLNKDGSLTRKGRKAFRDSKGNLNDAGLAYYNSQGYGMKREKHAGVYSRVSGNGGYFQPSETATGKTSMLQARDYMPMPKNCCQSIAKQIEMLRTQ